MTSTQELACVYASLILQDEDVSITADKIAAILKAANVSVEPFWPGLFAKALSGVDVAGLIANIGSGAGSAASAPAAAGGAAPAAAAAPAAEKKKEEAKEESDDDMGFGLFD
ncbi:60S acidic ribosomal protein P1 [Strongyloides ratti]|uniref:Large ribosomal subunit protein P1 n=2 Tax=Strongyloides ratti TaxID=34506 RepID=A0A090LCS1_STRRB|nr:60S acidic ribosomal protein P1 [Strongyloides ratti]CEF67562.1 60S acidic ribosomal protein P1 [Strongyloides ratti]